MLVLLRRYNQAAGNEHGRTVRRSVRISLLQLHLATDWAVRGSNPGRGEIIRTRPELPWGPPALPYNGYRVSFPGVRGPVRGPSPPSSGEIKEREVLYLNCPSGPPRPVLGWDLPLPLPFTFLDSSLLGCYAVLCGSFRRFAVWQCTLHCLPLRYMKPTWPFKMAGTT